MPTYDYECPDCSHAFEEFQSITAKPLRKCPRCGRRKLRRLIGAGAGLIFKGSGFYLTDYARKGETKTDSKPETGGEAKAADSKPAATSPAESSASEAKKPAPKPGKDGK